MKLTLYLCYCGCSMHEVKISRNTYNFLLKMCTRTHSHTHINININVYGHANKTDIYINNVSICSYNHHHHHHCTIAPLHHHIKRVHFIVKDDLKVIFKRDNCIPQPIDRCYKLLLKYMQIGITVAIFIYWTKCDFIACSLPTFNRYECLDSRWCTCTTTCAFIDLHLLAYW